MSLKKILNWMERNICFEFTYIVVPIWQTEITQQIYDKPVRKAWREGAID